LQLAKRVLQANIWQQCYSEIFRIVQRA